MISLGQDNSSLDRFECRAGPRATLETIAKGRSILLFDDQQKKALTAGTKLVARCSSKDSFPSRVQDSFPSAFSPGMRLGVIDTRSPRLALGLPAEAACTPCNALLSKLFSRIACRTSWSIGSESQLSLRAFTDSEACRAQGTGKPIAKL